MAQTVTRRAARSIAGSVIVLLFLASACAAPERVLAPRPSPALARARLPISTPFPPPVLDLTTPGVTPGPTAAPSTATGTAAPVTPSATPSPYLGKEALVRWLERLSALRAGGSGPTLRGPALAQALAVAGLMGPESPGAEVTTAEVQAGAPGSQATLALVGDSWVDGDVILGAPLRDALQARYGDAGPGFVEFGGGGDAKGAPYGQDVTYERAGFWTVHDAFTQPAGRGVDLADAGSTDVATPASITLSGTFGEAILHYLKMPGGGSFRWRVDAGPWRQVSTASPGVALATERIEAHPAGRHTLKIEVASAGTAGVRLAGADLRKPGSGVRVDRIGMNGAAAADYARADAGLWEAGLSALNPDLVILLLGTNDEARERLPSEYREDMDALVTRIRAAVPLAGILLLAPGDNNLKTTGKAPVGIEEYNAQLRALALERDLAFLDCSQVVGPFASANARGLYYDDVHINQDGGKVLAAYLLENLLDLP